MFGTHCDMRQLVEETWIWDDRHGLQKPERFSKIIAENLTRLLTETAKEGKENGDRLIKLRDEKMHTIYKRRNTLRPIYEDQEFYDHHFMQSKYRGLRI